jgi:putative phosphoesterase
VKRRKYRRIGFIGDIHAEDELLERALDVLEARGGELVAATGDVADGAGSVDRCCQLLETRKVVVVRGNHDRWLLAGTARDLPDATPPECVTAESRRLLAQLPEMVEFETVQGSALLCHGLGPNDMAKVSPDDYGYAIEANEDLQNLLRSGAYRWILNGHSHRRMVRQFGKVTLVNAGTLIRHQEPGFVELDFESASAVPFAFGPTGRIEGGDHTIALGDCPTGR